MLLPDFHRQIRALSWLVMGMLGGHTAAQSQTAPDAPPLVLRSSSLLEERIPPETLRQVPTFVQSNQLSEQASFLTTLDGQVVMRRGELLLKADKVDYDQTTDLLKARGNVYINRGGFVYQGPELDLYVDAFEGFFTQPTFQMKKNHAYGNAERIDFIDPDNSVLHKATYTSCQRKPGPSWVPDWFFESEKITVDTARNSAKLEGADLRFKGVPLPLPSMEVPLTDERKSGLLPPSIGADNIGGFEYSQPIYWNLAPNRDITFYPTYWSTRGLNLGTEFRYTEGLAPMPPFQGQLRVDWMSQDQLRNNAQRWGVNYTHTGLINPSFNGGTLGLTMNVNRVSDDNYWKDFAFTNSSSTGVSRLLNSDVGLSWTDGFVTTGFRAQQWQTLQDLANTSNRIAPPFDRLPQLTARLQRFNLLGGFDFSLDGDLTRFQSVRNYDCSAATGTTYNNCAPNADRAVTWAQLSRPFVTPYGYITPKVQLHGRSYQFDGGLPTTGFYAGHQGQSSASVTVPTFSLDAGMAFERDTRWLNRGWTQTLEPRVFYVDTPYRNQNYLPNYDSGGNAFNFASIFTENAFGGHDRISDSKLLTLGATSRFVDPETGVEGARFGVAQRLRFKEQRVTLPEDPAVAPAGISDILAGASINLTRQWALDSTVQYDPKTSNLLRRVIGGRYNPGSYRVLNAALRTENDTAGKPVSQQLDLGWQWPLHDLWGAADNADGRGLGEGRWYSVSRINLDVLNKKPVESIIGFEYDAGCWVSRVVLERMQVAEGVARQRLLFQLEFIGFTRIGTNATGSIMRNIPRYQSLNPASLSPSRFGNYD
jgi:LPS-assembly protein